MMTTVIGRARCGSMIQEKKESAPAPSISAASFCSRSSDCSAVKRISVAKGSHCQATIRMTESSGAWANQSIGAKPSEFAIQAKKPETGCISRFFQTSALTVGMMKNGAITISRTMPWPKIGWSSSSASSVPSTTVMSEHRADQDQRVDDRGGEGGVGEEVGVVVEADEAGALGVEQIVALRARSRASSPAARSSR